MASTARARDAANVIHELAQLPIGVVRGQAPRAIQPLIWAGSGGIVYSNGGNYAASNGGVLMLPVTSIAMVMLWRAAAAA
jgi:hypothetical protein